VKNSPIRANIRGKGMERHSPERRRKVRVHYWADDMRISKISFRGCTFGEGGQKTTSLMRQDYDGWGGHPERNQTICRGKDSKKNGEDEKKLGQGLVLHG